MNKYDMTLRAINHDKPLLEYDEVHKTDELVKCINLYNDKKLDDYQPNDIRMMISQQVCLDEMLPLALEILRDNEMSKVEHYPGDLLSAVVRISKSYWSAHKSEQEEINQMLLKLNERIQMFTEIFE